MLIEFSFRNFRSFRDKNTLSLVASTRLHSDSDLGDDGVFSLDLKPKLSLLRGAAIYGANASGKSNVIAAVSEFKHAVQMSANRGFSFPSMPFLLNNSSPTEPIMFEVIFALDLVQYRYGFEIQYHSEDLNEATISEEWLYRATSSKEAKLFERSHATVTKGSALTGVTGLLEDRRLKRPEALFLSLAAQIGNAECSLVADYLDERLRIISGLQDSALRTYTQKCIEANRNSDLIRRIVRQADTGISNVILVEKEEIEIPNIGADVPNEIKEHLREQIIRDMRLQAEHHKHDSDGVVVGTVQWPIAKFESQGTQKLFAFAGPIADTLENGRVLFIDELEAKLHPNLTRALVRLFQSPASNPHNAQLVFVTHDVNLLDQQLLRRDQIWFVEKDRVGASHLYSLAEFRGVRPTANIADEYMAGRYGALPNIDERYGLTGIGSEESDGAIPISTGSSHAGE